MRIQPAAMWTLAFALIALGACSKPEPAAAPDAASPTTGTTAPVTAAAAPTMVTGTVDLEDFAVLYADVFLVQMRAQKLMMAAARANDAGELAKLKAATERSVVQIVERHGMPMGQYKEVVKRLNADRALSQQVADRVQKILKDRGDLPKDTPRAVVDAPAGGR